MISKCLVKYTTYTTNGTTFFYSKLWNEIITPPWHQGVICLLSCTYKLFHHKFKSPTCLPCFLIYCPAIHILETEMEIFSFLIKWENKNSSLFEYKMPPVSGRLMGRIIIVTVQQTCHFDITKGDFSSAGPGQMTGKWSWTKENDWHLPDDRRNEKKK